MKHHAQQGIGALAIIMSVLVLAVVAGGGWYVGARQRSGQPATANKPAATTTAKQAPVTDPLAGWKTFTAPVEKFSFKYPADWKLTSGSDTVDTNQEAYAVTAPSGFELSYDVYKTNPGVLQDYCAGCEAHQVKLLTDAHYSMPLYSFLVSNTYNTDIKNTELTVSYKQRLEDQQYKPWGNYASKQLPGYVVRWKGYYPKLAQDQTSFTVQQAMGDASYQTAQQILQTLRY